MVTLEHKGKYLEYYHYDTYQEYLDHCASMEKAKGYTCGSAYEENNENWEMNAVYFKRAETFELLEKLENENSNNLYKQIADSMIDWYCETYSAWECIELLLGMGYSKEELEKVYFSVDDINIIEERMKGAN